MRTDQFTGPAGLQRQGLQKIVNNRRSNANGKDAMGRGGGTANQLFMFIHRAVCDEQDARRTVRCFEGEGGRQSVFHFCAAHVSIELLKTVPSLGDELSAGRHHVREQVLEIAAKKCDVEAVGRPERVEYFQRRLACLNNAGAAHRAGAINQQLDGKGFLVIRSDRWNSQRRDRHMFITVGHVNTA